MVKRVILVTGTPCVGKTSVARLLATRLQAFYINLTDLAAQEKLVLKRDAKRDSMIVDEEKMKSKIDQILSETSKDLVIDGHYAVNVVPEESVTCVFVLRRDPVELGKLMEQRGYSESKVDENVASEILDVCLIDALNAVGMSKVCEVDVTGKGVEEVLGELLQLMENLDKCRVGVVDWLGKLESEGLLNKYLKI